MCQARSLLLAAVCWLAGGTVLAGPPVTYWQCDPVGPDETLMLFGDRLGPQARILAAPLDDVEPGAPEAAGKPRAAKEQELKILQDDPQCVKLLIPASWRWGCYRVQLQTPEGTAQMLVNRPEVWWFLGDAGPAVLPGGECRFFGKNLWLGPTTGTWPGRVMLRTAAGRFQQLPVLAANRYAVTVRLPADLPAGRYTLWLHHGHGGPAGWSNPVEITIQPAPSWPSTLYNVRDFGAKGDGLTDDTTALRAALEQCQKNGGGIVFLPRGRYQVSSSLTLPRFTVLRGEAANLTALFWPDLASPPEALLKGTNSFALENFTIYASFARHIIMGDLGDRPEAGNVRLWRVRSEERRVGKECRSRWSPYD